MSDPPLSTARSVYTFKAQLEVGENGEAVLDDFFSQWYSIAPASKAEQLRGIDRWFTPKHDGLDDVEAMPVEYKTDMLAGKTGNAYIEIVSQHSPNHWKLGWALTTASKYVIYYVPNEKQGRIYVIDVAKLRDKWLAWVKVHKARSCANPSYKSDGILVPLTEVEKVSKLMLMPAAV